MCCRQKWAKVLTTMFSVGAALGGLLVISFCFKLILGTDDILGDSEVYVVEGAAENARTTSLTPEGVSPIADSKRSKEGLDEISQRIAIVAFSVGISAVVFGLTGICAAKIRRCPCTCAFGAFALILSAAYAFCSFLILQIYYVTNEELTDFCNDDLNLDNVNALMRKMVQEAEDYVYSVDQKLIKAVDGHMCNDYCPCDGKDWKNGDPATLYGTSTAVNFVDPNSDYNFTGDQTIFTECYADRKNIWKQEFADEYDPIDEEVLNLITTLEEDFDCSGICKFATFWASKSIKTGPPPQACIYKLKDSFDEDMVLIGWSIVATGIMTFFMLCCHCGLYLERNTADKKGPGKKRFIFD